MIRILFCIFSIASECPGAILPKRNMESSFKGGLSVTLPEFAHAHLDGMTEEISNTCGLLWLFHVDLTLLSECTYSRQS